MSLAGTTMVTVADGMYSPDHAAAKDSVLGDMLCLLSAVIYGAYTVSIRWVHGRVVRRQMGAWLGWEAQRQGGDWPRAWPSWFVAALLPGTADGLPVEDAATCVAWQTQTKRPLLHVPHVARKLLREDEETPMTMFFGFMGLLIFAGMGPVLLILWCAPVSVPPARRAACGGCVCFDWCCSGTLVAAGRQRCDTSLVLGQPYQASTTLSNPPNPHPPPPASAAPGCRAWAWVR